MPYLVLTICPGKKDTHITSNTGFDETGIVRTSATPNWRLIGGFAAATVLIHFLTNNRYGYFIDELYFIACGNHLSWGYVDLPPMVPAIAHFTQATLGSSLFAIRFFPALAGGATVTLAGVLASEFGGRRFAQGLAMLATITAPIYLGIDTLLTMNAFEPIFWTGCVFFLVRALNGGDPRWWAGFGISAGLGLENKESMLFLGIAIVVSLALTSKRNLILSGWFWIGGGIALLLFLPTLLWQASHRFPMVEELANINASNKNVPQSPFSFFVAQLAIFLPFAFAVWGAGLYFLLISRDGKYRSVGFTYLVLFAAFVLFKGKHYYIAPIYPALFGAGGTQLELVTSRGWRPLVRYALPAALVIEGAVAAPMTIPVLSVKDFLKYRHTLGLEEARTETIDTGELPLNFAYMFGWPELAAAVADIYWKLPIEERAQACIFAANYGEAAAIDFFGPRFRLPGAISNHMSYWIWGPGNHTGNVVIAIGSKRQDLEQEWSSVELAATLDTRYSPPNERVTIFLCRKPRLPLPQLWPRIKRYG
jgi:hypothetical protein